MKAKIVGLSDAAFPHFSLGQDVDVVVNDVGEGMHEVFINEVKHIMEIKRVKVLNTFKIVFEGMITDNANVGKMAIELQYSEKDFS